MIANSKTEGNAAFASATTKSASTPAPRTVAEVTAQTAGYKMLEKLQVSNLPLKLTKEGIMKLMTIFGKVVNIELITDSALKKFNVMIVYAYCK